MDNMEFRDQPYLGAVFVFSKDLSGACLACKLLICHSSYTFYGISVLCYSLCVCIIVFFIHAMRRTSFKTAK